MLKMQSSFQKLNQDLHQFKEEDEAINPINDDMSPSTHNGRTPPSDDEEPSIPLVEL